MNLEFENLLNLLSSTYEPNVRLGFQLARNYEAEVEAHFGYSRQDIEELFEHADWDLQSSFFEITALGLENKDLELLPKATFLLKKLQLISLRHNQFQTILFEIGKLKELEILHLEGNKLQALPVKIECLQSLKELYLEDNQLQTLPAEIGQLKKIFKLYLENNQLQTLPAEMGKLRNLEYLSLRNNQLQTLPAEIGQLKNLKGLSLSNNPLQSLPEELCNLKNATIFIKGTPKDMFIPEKLKQMGTLEYD